MFSVKIINRLNRKAIRRTFSGNVVGEKTALYDFHVENGGKIVNFGGYLLPVMYNDFSMVNSHLFTRKNASLFDVSHMLQTEIRGNRCIDFLESICTADIQGTQINGSTLTIFTNENGGIIDDLIVTKITDDHLYLVSNAARKQHDQQLMLKALEKYKRTNLDTDIKIKFFDPKERSLLALQGPKAAEALQNLTEVDLSNLYFMNTTTATVTDVKDCRITRCGYTGEDGFEISIPASDSVNVAKVLLENNCVKLAGLGVRDSLRMEAGLCLYGNDITETTTPIQAALTWLVAKRRREMRNFPGAEIILEEIQKTSPIKRIGLLSSSGPPARQGAIIFSVDGKELGKVTSGCPSPSLGKNIAMGYVSTDYSKIGTKVSLKIRDKLYEATVSKMPFVKANYYVKPKQNVN
ncbi:aminomethyltransferase, mitochondrial [Diorhabda carinulata]|uniref:aminomethyltransferase, mitochondrial n=1 Tax=Diorhabda carinulata TaxID=1163345 RepID=UPI0025A1BC10|nr:aminomethyltransferase, mitochondrial [Diorhabda carinulata]